MCAEAQRFTLAKRQGDMPTPNRMACNYILNYRIAICSFHARKDLRYLARGQASARASLWATVEFSQIRRKTSSSPERTIKHAADSPRIRQIVPALYVLSRPTGSMIRRQL
jgi:hypothetical protein